VGGAGRTLPSGEKFRIGMLVAGAAGKALARSIPPPIRRLLSLIRRFENKIAV